MAEIAFFRAGWGFFSEPLSGMYPPLLSNFDNFANKAFLDKKINYFYLFLILIILKINPFCLFPFLAFSDRVTH